MSRTIFFIAGEASGDVIGAGLIGALKEAQPSTQVMGIGGELMQGQGLETLLPMNELCVMGIWEVLWQLPRLIKLINGVVEEIEAAQPDVVVTIDLPDFNFQVAKKLKQRGIFTGKLVHYVAPSVWAWRPKRAEKVAASYDGLLCLFPFEPEYFTPHGLKAECVGHPLVERDFKTVDADSFRRDHEITPDVPVLGVFLGSRPSEIYKMAPVFIETVSIVRESHPDLEIVVPTLPDVEYEVIDVLRAANQDFHVVANPDIKWNAVAACDLGLAVSGTMGLELAYMGMPHVIGYKTHPITYQMVKRLIQVKYAHLANILLDKLAVPEFLQHACTSLKISRSLLEMMDDKAIIDQQVEAFNDLRAGLGGVDEKTPSEKAAAFVLEI